MPTSRGRLKDHLEDSPRTAHISSQTNDLPRVAPSLCANSPAIAATALASKSSYRSCAATHPFEANGDEDDILQDELGTKQRDETGAHLLSIALSHCVTLSLPRRQQSLGNCICQARKICCIVGSPSGPPFFKASILLSETRHLRGSR